MNLEELATTGPEHGSARLGKSAPLPGYQHSETLRDEYEEHIRDKNVIEVCTALRQFHG